MHVKTKSSTSGTKHITALTDEHIQFCCSCVFLPQAQKQQQQKDHFSQADANSTACALSPLLTHNACILRRDREPFQITTNKVRKSKRVQAELTTSHTLMNSKKSKKRSKQRGKSVKQRSMTRFSQIGPKRDSELSTASTVWAHSAGL